MRHNWIKAALAAAVLLGAVELGVRPALAQHSSMSMSVFQDEGTFTPELSRGDLDVFKRVLTLKPEEVRAMEDLYGAYAAALKDEGQAVRDFVAEKMEESEAMKDQRLLEPAQKRLTEWSKRSEQLKKSFMDDLKSLLTRDQEARWPIVERELRRMKGVNGSGRIPGEGVDLVKLMEDVPAESRRPAEIGEILERYSQELDTAMRARNDYVKDNREAYEAAKKSDAQEALKIFRKATREREAMADVNDKYVREVCAHLSESEAQKLRDRYFKLSYPLLSKGTRGERYITAAAKLEGLTSEQRSQVEAILAEYDRERRVILGKMAAVEREGRLTELPEDLEKLVNPPAPPAPVPGAERRYNTWAQGVSEDHPMFPLRRARFELDRSFRARLDGVLTAEQRGQLPDSALEHVTFYDDSPMGL